MEDVQNSNKNYKMRLPLILASSSPRRKKLLEQIGIEFQVCPSKISENSSLKLSPESFAEYWAKKKAIHVAQSYPLSLVVAADTIVVIDKEILGKPKNKRDSIRMLRCLSNRTHKVLTGVHFSFKKHGIDRTINETTKVFINKISDSDIHYYINNYSPFDKAGSYGIQDWFSIHVKKIEGCYFNVMGLPIAAFHKLYRQIKSDLGLI
ncbi:MAG: septum formation protein Maf [Candidatus Marinimicrobia bacterium]|nr:septum formation protein Maf [Candidatus Neomarinimicrobiota bacterium]